MRRGLTVAAVVLLAGGGFLAGYGLFAGADEVAEPPARAYTEQAACEGCPFSVDSAELQTREGSTLFIFGGDWPAAVDELTTTISLTANDVRLELEPGEDGFVLAVAERGGEDIDPAAVAAGLRAGNLLVNLTDDVVTTPVTFVLALTGPGGEARLPRTGQLVWDGTGPPTRDEAGTQPEPETEAPEAFAAALASAFRAGDQAFLLERLNPAVIQVYGEEQCAAEPTSTPDPTRAFAVISVSELEPYVYNPDGLTIPIPEAYTVVADVTAGGETAPGRELHFAPVGDFLTWFTDCGDPLTTN